MKFIGLTQQVVIDTDRAVRRDAVDQRWTTFLSALGMTPLPLPNHTESALRIVSASRVRGILLTGGNDLESYGGDAPERDAMEMALVSWARERRVPVLGVCRGMQMILHSFGTKLIAVEGHVASRHRVTTSEGERMVNSYHRFTAFESGPELDVLAKAEDGSIESVRHSREAILGVMWHPERTLPADEADVEMIRSFFGIDG